MRSLHKSRTACPSLGPAVPVPLLPGSMKKDFNGHPSITPQLEGYGAPKPSATSNEDPLIAGRMRTFPDNHPSLGSVRNAKSLGCPALIFNQMTSDQWKSTTQAQIGERQPTFKKGRREALTLTRHATKQRTAATYCTTPPTALTHPSTARRPPSLPKIFFLPAWRRRKCSCSQEDDVILLQEELRS